MIAEVFARAHPKFADVQYFDRIAVPSPEEMAALYGSPD
jgi:hypothetical protein